MTTAATAAYGAAARNSAAGPGGAGAGMSASLRHAAGLHIENLKTKLSSRTAAPQSMSTL